MISFFIYSNAVTTVNMGRVGDHRTELPANIGAEMDAMWRKLVEARVGLSSYQALWVALV